MTINIAVLGTGSSLQAFHFPLPTSLPHLFRVHTVYERVDRGVARKVCGEGVRVVSSLQEVWDDPEVELVVVATPDKTHFEYVTAALNAGKHVLVEKPITLISSEALQLAAVAKEKNLILSVFQNRRWDGDFMTLQEVIKSGELGPLNECVIAYDRHRPFDPSTPSSSANATSTPGAVSWKDDPTQFPGTIYSLGTHTIDQAYVLFGLPESVFARIWDGRGSGLDENHHLQFFYPSALPSSGPLTVHIKTNYLSPLPPSLQLKYQAKGITGTYTKYGGDNQGGQLMAGLLDSEAYGVEEEKGWGEMVWLKRGKKGGDGGEEDYAREKIPTVRGDYRKLYINLAEAITARDPSKLSVKVEECIAVIRLIELSFQSSKEGRVLPVPREWR